MIVKMCGFERTVIRLICLAAFVLLFSVLPLAAQQKLTLDERPAEPGEWGYRPGDGAVSQVSPPSFSWRPQQGLSWEIECARDTKFKKIEYRATDVTFNVHCPPRVLRPGTYTWRYRGRDAKGRYTNWSRARTFTITKDLRTSGGCENWRAAE